MAFCIHSCPPLCFAEGSAWNSQLVRLMLMGAGMQLLVLLPVARPMQWLNTTCNSPTFAAGGLCHGSLCRRLCSCSNYTSGCHQDKHDVHCCLAPNHDECITRCACTGGPEILLQVIQLWLSMALAVQQLHEFYCELWVLSTFGVMRLLQQKASC